MHFGLLQDIAQHIPLNKALLGLDVGKKTIGVALSTSDHSISLPLCTIKRVKFSKDMVQLSQIVSEHGVAGFIIGLPINMDGSEGPRAQSIRDFAREMLNHADVVGDHPWLALHDERLSTSSVHDIVDEHVDKRKTKINAKDSGLIDKLAAHVILESALNFIQNA